MPGIRKESDYLIISNRAKCSEIIANSELSEEDVIDALISLHLVLEIGLNTIFRYISLWSIRKDVPTLDIINNIDRVSFLDKTTMFIYNSKFNLVTEDDFYKATEYHSLIERIKDFSSMRNRLLHGYSICSVFDGSKNIESSTKSKINLENLQRQITKFKLIMEGMRFYVDKLDCPITKEGKENLKKSYLDDSFLPILKVL